jgi:hypothetical protein
MKMEEQILINNVGESQTPAPPPNTADRGLQEWAGNAKSYLSQNWLRYLTVIVTGTLTGIAGWTLTGNAIYTAFIILLAEGSSLFWAARTEDNGNKTQTTLSVIGTVVAWTAIILTDLSSATILANQANREVFTVFAKVPAWSQMVVTFVLPVLATTHGILAVAHYFYSEDARLNRDLAKTEREAKRVISQAEADARKNIAKAQANRFKELAEERAEGIGRNKGDTLWEKRYEKPESSFQTSENLVNEQPDVTEHGNNGTNPTRGRRK